MTFGFSTNTTTIIKTGDNNIDGLLGVRQWASTTVTFSFTNSFFNDYEFGYPNAAVHSGSFESLNLVQRSVARSWMEMFESVSGLNLVELTGSSDRDATIRIAESNDPGTAYAYYPGSTVSGGDIWFNRNDFNAPVLGNYAYYTSGHEIGHALGLKHGHESHGFGEVAMNPDRDSMEFSIMTYRSYINAPTDYVRNETYGYAQSLMMYDIRAIQQMYGANFNYNATNTTYTFSTTTGEMFVNGVGQGTPGANRIFRTIWDGNGIDTYNFSNYSTDLSIDLAPGGWSDLDVGGNFQRAALGDDHYARGHVFNALQFNGDGRSLIENAIGGSGDDTISGNIANNSLSGNAGDDSLWGLEGNDSLWGGLGKDSLYGGAGDDDLAGGAGNDVLDGETGNDRLWGDAGQDWLNGGAGNDELTGGTGNDTVNGGTGNDQLWGEAGRDWLNGGSGDDDLVGGTGHDTLLGGADTDRLWGEAGNDFLWGESGNDLLIGGAGNDYLSGTSYSAQGTGEIDILFSGDASDSDIFVLGERQGGLGQVFYDDQFGSDYAILRDFDIVTSLGNFADRIQLMGTADSYSIANTAIDGIVGAGIHYFGDLIGIVQGVNASSLNLTNSNQFLYV